MLTVNEMLLSRYQPRYSLSTRFRVQTVLDYLLVFFIKILWLIGFDTKTEVIVASPTTWEAHHSPRASPSDCGELPRSLVTPHWSKSRYQFQFYHDASMHIVFMQFRVCKSRKLLTKLYKIAFKQPLWQAQRQTIVTAASIVTPWLLPLWCHNHACVTKSWQYASLKN